MLMYAYCGVSQSSYQLSSCHASAELGVDFFLEHGASLFSLQAGGRANSKSKRSVRRKPEAPPFALALLLYSSSPLLRDRPRDQKSSFFDLFGKMVVSFRIRRKENGIKKLAKIIELSDEQPKI